MNTEQLAEIKARCEAATPGPWQQGAASMYSGRKLVHQDAAARKVNPLGWQRACICREARPDDARFIAHARTDIPVLLELYADRLRDLEHEFQRANAAEAEVTRLQNERAFDAVLTPLDAAEILALRAEGARLRAALEAVEWSATEGRCLWCEGFVERGHLYDCQRQLALGLQP